MLVVLCPQVGQTEPALPEFSEQRGLALPLVIIGSVYAVLENQQKDYEGGDCREGQKGQDGQVGSEFRRLNVRCANGMRQPAAIRCFPFRDHWL